MATCKWDEFTGVSCKKEADAVLRDSRRGIDVPVCREHFDEFRTDHNRPKPNEEG